MTNVNRKVNDVVFEKFLEIKIQKCGMHSDLKTKNKMVLNKLALEII